DALVRRVARPVRRGLPADRRSLVHAEDVLLRARLHVDPRHASPTADRPAHVPLLEGADPADAHEPRGHSDPAAGLPEHPGARGDRELDPPRRLRAAAALRPASSARRAPRAAADRGLMVDFIEPALFAILTIALVAAGAALVLPNRFPASALLHALTVRNLVGTVVPLGP